MGNSSFYHFNFVEELEKALHTKVLYVECPEAFSSRPAIHVIWTYAHWLFRHTKWLNQLKGPKIVVEHDAYLNFLTESPYYGMWDELCRKSKIDTICSSGKYTTERLIENKINTVWIPKGCDARMLSVENTYSGKFCAFTRPMAQRGGSKFHFYRERDAMEEIVKNLVDIFQSNPSDFCQKVPLYSAGCQNDAGMKEPMAKHFECSAMGCVPIRDKQPELLDLGYDERSMIVYDSIKDIPDIIQFYKDNPNLLLQIQKMAKEITRNHTWGHRAAAIASLVKEFK